MGKKLPQRVYYSLPDLESLWSVSASEIKEWLVHRQLVACVWLPLMLFHEEREREEGACVVLTRELVHHGGYTRLNSHRCRALFSKGELCLREFPNEAGDGRLMLPDEADCYSFTLSELVVLDEERERFESLHGLRVPKNGEFDPSFKILRHEGKSYSFGDMQAQIVRLLYEAAENGEAWQHGKRILGEVGSQSYTLSNVFRGHPCLLYTSPSPRDS